MSQEVQGMLIRLEATTAQMRQELARADATVSMTAGNIDRRLGTIDGAFNRLGLSAQAMSRMLSGAFAAVSVGSLVSQADAYANIASRLKLVTSTAQEFTEAQKAVFDIAQSSYQPLGATAELYQRIATNQKELGLSGKEVAGIVGTISKSMAVSGASAASANAALVQLGQAFASGVLRGEELNSVMEQAPALAQAIAKGMGKTVGELRTLGADGKLTADAVVKALQSQAAAVDELFAKTNTTVGNSLTAMANSTTRFIGELDQAAQASAGMAQGILKLSKAMDASLPQALTFARENSSALEQAMTTGLLVALARVAGGFAQQRAQAMYAAAQMRETNKETAAFAKHAYDSAASSREDAKASLERARAGVESAKQQGAANVAAAQSELDRTKAVRASIEAEREQAVQRKNSQLSVEGRAAAQAKIDEIDRRRVQIISQATIAQRNLTEAEASAKRQTDAAIDARRAASAALTDTTGALNNARIASDRAAASVSVFGRAMTGLRAAGAGLLGMMGGPLGLVFMVGAAALSFVDFRSDADKAREGLQNMTGPLDDVIARFKQLTRDQQAASLVKWGEAQASAASAADKEFNTLLGTLRDGIGGVFIRPKGGINLFLDIKKELLEARAAGQSLSTVIEKYKDNPLVSKNVLNDALKVVGAYSEMDKVAKDAGNNIGSLTKVMEDTTKAQSAVTASTDGMTAAGKRYADEQQKKLAKAEDNNDAVKEANRYIAEHKDLTEADKKKILENARAIEAQEKANKAATKATRDANKAVHENSGQKMLDDAKQRYAVLLEQKDAIEDQADGSRTLGVEAKKLVQLEQEIAQLKEKKTLTTAQKQVLAMADLNIAQQRQNAELEKANALTKIQLENKAKLIAFQEQLNEQLQLAKEGLDVEVAGTGMGQKQRGRLQEDLRIRGDYQKQLAKLQRDYQNIVNPTAEQKDLYDKETQAVKDALAERLRYQADYYRDLDAAQSNWKNGATAAWQDYISGASDIAGQTYEVFQNAFKGMEDALTNFVMTGKLSFKDLTNSIIADIARIVVRTQIVTPLLNSLFSGGSSGGVAGLLASAASSGSSVSTADGAKGGAGVMLDSAGNFVDYAAPVINASQSGVFTAIGQGYSSGGLSGAWDAGKNFVGEALDGTKGGAGVMLDSSGNMVNTNSISGGANLAPYLAALSGAIQGWNYAGAKGAAGGAAGGYVGYQAGATVGSYFGPIGTAIGAAIGAMLGSNVGSKLFGSKWYTTDSGVQLQVDNNQVNGSEYTVKKKKKAFFSGTAKKTSITSLSEAQTAAYQEAYDVTQDSVVALLEGIGVSLKDGAFEGFSIAAQDISLMGRTDEDAQQLIKDWFTQAGDRMIGFIDQGVQGFGYSFTQLTSIVTNFTGLNTAMKAMNMKALDLSISSALLGDAIVGAAGGLETLTTQTDAYYKAFIDANEQHADSVEIVRKQFTDLGMVLPDSRKAFSDMVKAIDVTSEAGREQFLGMMKLAEAAANAYGILEADQNSYYEAFYSEAERGAMAYNDIVDAFKEANLVLPANRAAFRAMVEGIDKYTESGKKLREQYQALATSADALYDAQESIIAANNEVLLGRVGSSLSAVQRAVAAEKTAMEEAHTARLSSLNDMLATAQSGSSALNSITSSLANALKTLMGSSEEATQMLYEQAKATVQSAIATARSGGSLADMTGLEDALYSLTANGTETYASLEDFAREQGRNANLVAELNGLAGKQLTTDQRLLKTIQDQIDAETDQYEAQLEGLNAQLALAQGQVDALNGIDNSVISVRDAVANLASSIVGALAAKPSGSGSSNTAANNSTLLDLVYQEVLGRAPDAAGAAYWSNQLATGAIDYSGLVAQMTADAIANGELKAYATGGLITGPGTGTSDSIIARLSNGEYVMSARAVQMFGTGLLDQMNAGLMPGFAIGGGVNIGETGPVLQITRPAQIYASQPQAQQQAGPSASDAATLAELRSILNEMRVLSGHAKKTSDNTGQIAEVGVQTIGTTQVKVIA